MGNKYPYNKISQRDTSVYSSMVFHTVALSKAFQLSCDSKFRTSYSPKSRLCENRIWIFSFGIFLTLNFIHVRTPIPVTNALASQWDKSVFCIFYIIVDTRRQWGARVVCQTRHLCTRTLSIRCSLMWNLTGNALVTGHIIMKTKMA